MTQKQILGMVGVAVAVLVFFFVYQQYAKDAETSMQPASQKKMEAGNRDKVMVTPVPDTIDGITGAIEAESSADLSALDEEESSSVEEVNADSESVNNLGTSYDENSL